MFSAGGRKPTPSGPEEHQRITGTELPEAMRARADVLEQEQQLGAAARVWVSPGEREGPRQVGALIRYRLPTARPR